jgi:hypothetical protein
MRTIGLSWSKEYTQEKYAERFLSRVFIWKEKTY